MVDFNPDKCLPSGISVKSGMDDILYNIGLSITSFRDTQSRRHRFFEPKVIFIVLFLYSILKVFCLVVDEHDPMAKYLCDFAPLIGRITIFIEKCIDYLN